MMLLGFCPNSYVVVVVLLVNYDGWGDCCWHSHYELRQDKPILERESRVLMTIIVCYCINNVEWYLVSIGICYKVVLRFWKGNIRKIIYSPFSYH
jgi:hypothetical protein